NIAPLLHHSHLRAFNTEDTPLNPEFSLASLMLNSQRVRARLSLRREGRGKIGGRRSLLQSLRVGVYGIRIPDRFWSGLWRIRRSFGPHQNHHDTPFSQDAAANVAGDGRQIREHHRPRAGKECLTVWPLPTPSPLPGKPSWR